MFKTKMFWKKNFKEPVKRPVDRSQRMMWGHNPKISHKKFWGIALGRGMVWLEQDCRWRKSLPA